MSDDGAAMIREDSAGGWLDSERMLHQRHGYFPTVMGHSALGDGLWRKHGLVTAGV